MVSKRKIANKIADLKFLQKLSHKQEVTDKDISVGIYKHKNGKEYLIKRTGKCDYKKCKAVCCRFICNIGSHEYFDNFGKKGSCGNNLIKINCNQLCKNNTCKIFKSKKFPRACIQFPHCTDALYHEVIKKCSFKFEIIGEIKRNNDK